MNRCYCHRCIDWNDPVVVALAAMFDVYPCCVI